MAIAATAGRPISLDSFTEKQRKKGFARVKVEIAVDRPLKPGVVVVAGDARFWQQFQFENLPPLCFLCGLLGHVEDVCLRRAPAARGNHEGLQIGEEGGGGGPTMPRLGPWISTSRIRQPRAAFADGSRMAGPDTGKVFSSTGPSSGPSSSSPAKLQVSTSSPPGSPSDSEGWQKPSKVARKAQGIPGTRGLGVVGGMTSALEFAPLALLGDQMELGVPPMPVMDSRMMDHGQPLLKRPRSPPPKGKGKGKLSSAEGLKSAAGSSLLPLPQRPASSQGSSSPGNISAVSLPSGGKACPSSAPSFSVVSSSGEGTAGDRIMSSQESEGGSVMVPVGLGLVFGDFGVSSGGRSGPDLLPGSYGVEGEMSPGVEGVLSAPMGIGSSSLEAGDKGKGVAVEEALVQVDIKGVVPGAQGGLGFFASVPVLPTGSVEGGSVSPAKGVMAGRRSSSKGSLRNRSRSPAVSAGGFREGWLGVQGLPAAGRGGMGVTLGGGAGDLGGVGGQGVADSDSGVGGGSLANHDVLLEAVRSVLDEAKDVLDCGGSAGGEGGSF